MFNNETEEFENNEEKLRRRIERCRNLSMFFNSGAIAGGSYVFYRKTGDLYGSSVLLVGCLICFFVSRHFTNEEIACEKRATENEVEKRHLGYSDPEEP